MKWFRLTSFAVLASTTLGFGQATALSEDDKSMGTPSSNARFSDPDEQTPGQAVYMQNGKAASDGVDPSSIRYDYDPASGSYVPHKQ
jgi:hypothetical protein